VSLALIFRYVIHFIIFSIAYQYLVPLASKQLSEDDVGPRSCGTASRDTVLDLSLF
jgi:hypothetical protein